MPHALLLSPDDQAVSAITGVLEEMSVTCERPLDGLSAAQKLNSQSFDLVLVDCENLPAAKLIFDVCRRGKNGNNPVPIAIVDGRAGLPTAFRLGAELILTKPVSKDQARTTIRTAVSRVRKDVPASESASVPAESSTFPGASTTSLLMSNADHSVAMGAAAAASPQLTSFAEPVPSFAPSAPKTDLSATAAPAKTHSVPDAHDMFLPKLNPRSGTLPVSSPDLSESRSVPAASLSSRPKPPIVPSDDPVLADLERTELEEAAQAEAKTADAQKSRSALDKAPDQTPTLSDTHAPVFSSYQQKQKPRIGFVAMMVFVVAAGGFYGAWMYQPGFRSLAQPQIDRVLALAGRALPPTQTLQPTIPVARPIPAPAPVAATAPPADPGNTPSPAVDSTASTTPSSRSGLAPGTTTASAPAQPPAPPSTSVAPASSSPAATTPVVTKIAADKPVAKPAVSKPVELRRAAAAVPPSDAALPGENTAVILSSKGAEKRLAHTVSPKYPADARSEGTEGTVILKEVVDEDGKVQGVRLVEGNAALATAAMQAVKQWRYRPYVRDGKAQPFQTVVIVDFQKP